MLTHPRPGGVGEGIFYNPDFKTSWGLGTSFSCDYVCPTPPGGNVNTWLYITATNRSGLGVEAFVFLLWSGHAAFPRVRLGPDRPLAD